MKLLNKIFCLLILSIAFISCEKEYDRPPLTEPKYTGPEANITIKEFREKFKEVTQDKPINIEEELILKARIISSDETGNIYKTMYIQDETGGIGMLVDQSNVYSTYRRGQEVYINLKGMCASFYGDIQIGFPTGYLYRTPWEEFVEHVSVNGWPNEALIKVAEYTDISSLNENSDAVKATFVLLKNVHFVDGGKKTYVDTETENYGTRVLKDAFGNSIDVRTSSYANFANEMLPVGTGNVAAVLGNFNGTWQLSICNINDVYGFDGKDPEGGESGTDPEDPTEKTIFEETFKASQGAFTIKDVKLPEGGSYVWKWEEYNGDGYMKASAFVNGGAKESESWLISPEIDMTGATKCTLTFEHTHKFSGTPKEEHTLWITESGKENWEQLTINKYGTNSDYVFVDPSVDLSKYAGKKVQIAFKYKSTTSASGTWELKNVKVTAITNGDGDGGTVIIPE